MSSTWIYPFILFAGALQALGAAMSGQLKHSLTNPLFASLVSFGLIVLFFAGAFAIMPRPLPTLEGISSMPWWAPLAGLVGAVAVFAGFVFIRDIGAGPLNGLIITANILASLAIDHFGLVNMPIHQMNWARFAGGVLMVAGITLISKF